MGDSAKLVQALKPFCEKLRTVVEGGSEISVITHLDADGITSGSIMATALARMGARCSVRTVSDMNPGVIERMKVEARDFYVITDLGGGMAAQFRNALGDRWVVIDHHQIPEEEITTDDAGQVMNAWKFGIDGGMEVPAGGMAYMVASALDRKNRDLSCIAVVSAVGDRQDQGDKKSFLGVNKEILETAKSMGLVNVDLDIMLTGRETRPLHEALAFTSFPFIDGLTWNRDNCYNALKNANIKLKDNGNRWRVPAEFSQEEKSSILEAIAKFVVTSSKTSASVIDDLIGNVYTLAAEDKRSQLRDAREFATLLNACGRIGRSGVGVAICMGDRNAMLSAGEEISGEYRTTLRNYISTIFNEKWRVSDDGKVALVNGDGLVAEDMLGAVSSLLGGSQNLAGRLVFVRSLADDTYKFSSRKGLGSASKANLGLIMRHCAESVKGTGGGHAAAAGCRIPSSALDDFIACLRSAINDEKFATA